MPNFLIVRQGQSAANEPFNVFGDIMYVKLTGKDTDGRSTVIECVTPPNEGPPLHVHHRDDEGFYVIEGDFQFEIDGKREVAHTGDYLWVKRGTPHCFQNTGATTGRLLLTLEPSGAELFFGEIAGVEGPPDPAKLKPLFEKYGMELLGPPLSKR